MNIHLAFPHKLGARVVFQALAIITCIKCMNYCRGQIAATAALLGE